jgi:hypothetical protein
MFQGPALTWCNSVVSARGTDDVDEMPWTEFKELMFKKYCPRNEIQKLEQEFWKLEMSGPAHQEYTTRFQEVSKLVPHLSTPESKWVERYVYGLAPQVHGLTMSARPKTSQEAIEISATFTDEVVRNGAFAKVEPNDKRKCNNKNTHVRSGRNSNSFKRPANAIRSYAATQLATPSNHTGRVGYAGPHPLCNKCNLHHVGHCQPCRKCNHLGHPEKNCRMG